MTPKEKARELVNIYTEVIYPIINIEKDKQCALIAVEELQKNAHNNYMDNYWNEVKQEIKSL